MQFFKNYKITTKLILCFLFISFLTLTAAIYVSYKFSLKALKKEIENSLLVVADNKTNQIEAYSLKLKKDISTLFYTQEFIGASDKLFNTFLNSGIDSLNYQAVEQESKPMLMYYQQLFGYDDIMLISPDGEVVFSIQGEKKNRSIYNEALVKHSELSEVFMRSKTSQEIEISNFEYDQQNDNTVVFIALPIFKGSDFIGIAAVQISNKIFSAFSRDYTGLGRTGEAIMLSKIRNKAVFITPIRFDPQAAFKRKIKLNSEEGAVIQKALQGEKGSGTFLDYRGQQVLAVWRYLPTFRLGMLVKMDSAEVYASANKLRDTLLKIGFIILILAIFTAILIARSISRPIKALTETSKTISAGKFSARATVEAKDEIGELAQFFNQMTDSLVEAKAVVEQKNIEVEEQKKLLEMANKELDSFAYTVSHDLRAPLRGIDGLGVLLEQDYSNKFDEQGRDYLTKIRAAANRMKMLIEDLLKLSRISRIKNPYEDVNMDELIKSITARLEFDIQKYNVDIKIPSSLPIVYCDKIKIEEVLFNLISNAMKFSSKNKEANPRVEIGYNDKGDVHEFYIKDNGIGIDKKYHNEIFGIFRRLHAESEYEGTGAGLSIVKRIIKDHDGSIWIDSEVGKGAIFYFTIPKKLKDKVLAAAVAL